MRKLTVYEVGDVFYGKSVPQIRLQGKWLKEAGFLPNDKIIVRKKGNSLIIEKA